jgi:hypothetical protein
MDGGERRRAAAIQAQNADIVPDWPGGNLDMPRPATKHHFRKVVTGFREKMMQHQRR